MRINELPKEELPREKAIRYGISVLSNAELLAIILRTGTTGISVIDFSMQILAKFGGIEGFSNASYQELITIPGLKSAKALALMTLIEFAKRVNLQSYNYKTKVKNSKEVYELFEPQLRNELQEKLIAVYLDHSHRIISTKELFKGSSDRHFIHPRDIFREAVKMNSSWIILIHNHPSGDATPSNEDLITTKELFKIGEEIGVPIIDHMVIGKGQYRSIRLELEKLAKTTKY